MRDQVSVKSLVFFWAALVFFALPAWAGSESSVELGASGIAPPICNFSSALMARSGQNMGLAAGTVSSGIITISQMIDDATATLKPATIALSIRGLCNIPHNLTLASSRGALVSENASLEVQGTFLKKVHYRAIAQWGPATATLLADGGSASPTVSHDMALAHVGDLTIDITVDGANNDLTVPVVAGTYSDTLAVRIGARP